MIEISKEIKAGPFNDFFIDKLNNQINELNTVQLNLVSILQYLKEHKEEL